MRSNFSYYAFAKRKMELADKPLMPSDFCSEAIGLGANGDAETVRKKLRDAFEGLANTSLFKRVKVQGKSGYFYQSRSNLLKSKTG